LFQKATLDSAIAITTADAASLTLGIAQLLSPLLLLLPLLPLQPLSSKLIICRSS